MDVHVTTGSWREPGLRQDDSDAVVRVSWEDAQIYAAWLSVQLGRDYRLLTEAEWEYAARAGTTTPFWWGSTITPTQTNNDGTQQRAVGNFAANPWGLYQVHGNVQEWCEDIWQDNYDGAPSDGSAWLSLGHRLTQPSAPPAVPPRPTGVRPDVYDPRYDPRIGYYPTIGVRVERVVRGGRRLADRRRGPLSELFGFRIARTLY